MSHNILANMVGFRLDSQKKVIEFLPKNEQLNSENKRRAIFFNLYNYYVNKEMRLSKTEIKNGANIYEVFQNKIKSLALVEKKEEMHKKFVKLLSQNELLFDIDDMFLHLVYERAKKINPKATVHLLEKSIVIVDHREDVSSTLLIPSYMKLEKENINSSLTIKAQMDEACRNINESEKVKKVFLIYPKHPKFMKYINVDLHNKVKLREEEYRVKMIPYSFSFCTDRQNKHRNLNNRRMTDVNSNSIRK